MGDVHLHARVFLVLLVGLISTAMRADPPAGIDRLSAIQSQLRADIEFLSSEDLRGRGVDDAESIAKAANFIADRMKSIGIDTELFDGTPFQKVSLTLDAVVGSAERNFLSVNFPDDPQNEVANLDDGMNPLAIGSLAGQVTGPLVFVGYGITASKYNYDDYARVDAGGKIVIILRKEPGAADPASPFGGTRNTRHAFFSTKIANAISHGASAVVLVNDPSSAQRSADRVRGQIELEEQSRRQFEAQRANLPNEAKNVRKSLTEKIQSANQIIESLQRELQRVNDGRIGVAEAGQRPAGKDSVPVVSASRAFVDRLLQRSVGRRLVDIETQIDQSYAPDSFQLPGLDVSLQMELKPSVADSSNVVGTIPGKGPLADESVVVGAHYDHVGMGGYGSLAPGTIAIHNGADDNGSGTAALLSIAEDMRKRLSAIESYRRMIFIAFTGEERGLVGSKQYVRSPRFPLESTVAMINMDMVGRLHDNELTVYGTGSATMIDEVLEQANERGQFNLFKVATGYGPSDHQSFYEAGIPVIFFFTGLHNDYHRPTDDFDKINFGGLTRITDTVSNVTLQLATRKDRPRYTKTEGLAKIRRQLTAYLGVKLVDRNGRVVLAGLTEGGPAERGGLRIGDTIVKLAGRRIDKPSDVLEHVREHSPRDKVTMRVIRRGNMVDLTVELGNRPGE